METVLFEMTDLSNSATIEQNRRAVEKAHCLFVKCVKEIAMYGIARGKSTDFYPPGKRQTRANYMLQKSRGHATRASADLSRVEYGLLALDRLIRRVANRWRKHD